MATELQRRGVLPPFADVAPLLRSNPGPIEAVHRSYVAAGATLLLAATFRSLPHLSPTWAEDIDRAMALAQKAASTKARVYASFGSLGDPRGSWISATPQARAQALRGLADAVARASAAGATGVVLETLVDPDEALAMIGATRAACTLPVVASFVPRADGALFGGAAPQPTLAAALDAGATYVGLNCAGPASLEAAVARCDTRLVTWCKPSREGASDDALLSALLRLSTHAVVGGCCGVGPEVLARLPPTISP